MIAVNTSACGNNVQIPVPLEGLEVSVGHANPHTSNMQQEPSIGISTPPLSSSKSALMVGLAIQSAAACLARRATATRRLVVMKDDEDDGMMRMMLVLLQRLTR